MKEYFKINTFFKREQNGNNKGNIIENEYACPEFNNIKKWEVTEKIDGTNIRIGWNGLKVIFGGRTSNSQIPSNLYTELSNIFTAEKMKDVFGEDNFNDDNKAILYGEGFGRKIQKVGSAYRKEKNDFILFDVLIGDFWLKRESLEDIAKKLDIPIVPVIGLMTIEEIIDFIKSKPQSKISEEPLVIEEGLAVKSVIEQLYVGITTGVTVTLTVRV